MERLVEFNPAYDKRDKGCGIHGVDLRMILKGELGAVQFVLYTNWHLPDVTKQLLTSVKDELDIEIRFLPQPVDLGYHSPNPQYEGQWTGMHNCPYLDGKTCYYDGTSSGSNYVYERLLKEGDAGVWAALEEYYIHTFGELK